MIEVREATIDDADAIADAHIDGWRVGYRGVVADQYLNAEDFHTIRRERWRAWTWQTEPEVKIFVVSVADDVVGFGLVGPERPQDTAEPAEPDTDEPRGEVYAFYLHPRSWGSGAAAVLMSRCMEYLAELGLGTAVLWVLRDNPRARAFYEKMGWTPTGRTSNFAPSDSPDAPLPEVEYGVAL